MSISLIAKPLAALALIMTSLVVFSVSPAAAATTVTVSSTSDLRITGGSGHETVTLRPGEDGGYEVEVVEGSTTTVHEINTFIRDIIVNLRGGNDTFVLFFNADVPRDLKINMGSGSNKLNLTGADIGRNLRVTDGSGSLDLYNETMNVAGTTVFNLGGGHHDVESIFNRWEGDFAMTTSSTGSLDLHMSEERYSGSYRLTTGNKVDKVVVEYEVRFARSTTLQLKGGNDRLLVINYNELRGPLNVDLGYGNDFGHFSKNDFLAPYTVAAGGGNDVVSVFGNIFNASGTFNGGSGTDQLTGEANQVFDPMTVTSFEVN